MDGAELGARLVAVRESRGLSQEDVAQMLGVSRVLVSYWERGQRRASDAALERFAEMCGLSLRDLLNGGDAQPSGSLAEMLYRTAADEIGAEARSGLHEWERFLENYCTLLNDLNEEYLPLKDSPFFMRRGFTGKDDIRRKAEEVRAAYRLGFSPIGDLAEVLDEAGITVYRAPLGNDLQRSLSGAFLRHPRMGLCIVVNVETTPGRQAFAIAHELAHALYHSEQVGQLVSPWARRDERERFADYWASEFLIPFEGLRRAAESLGFKSVGEPELVVHLQRYFGVSYGVMLLRLLQAHFVDEAAYERLKTARPLVIAARLGYRVLADEWQQDREQWRLERFPRRFVRLLMRALREDRMSPSTAASMTGLTIDEMTDLARPSTEDTDPEVERELMQLENVRGIVAV